MVNVGEAKVNTENGRGGEISEGKVRRIERKVRMCDYLVVAQLFLRDNFLLRRKLEFGDVKPRLLGHWGTCHGINMVYANMEVLPNFRFILGVGHGFPALQANLLVDGELAKVDERAKFDEEGIEYICKYFSWPMGFPSHSSPMTPTVITEGGELGYALATAYGAALGKEEANVVVLIGDGELETGTALASMNLQKLVGGGKNGRVWPVLHLNGYKISGPTIYGRKSEREMAQLVRGFGYEPIWVKDLQVKRFQRAIEEGRELFEKGKKPFIIFVSEKGQGGPNEWKGKKIVGNFLAHQIPLPEAGKDEKELEMLEKWLGSYGFENDWKSWREENE